MDPGQAPPGLLDEPRRQRGVFVVQALSQIEHRVGAFGGVGQTLGKVAGVVPAAIEENVPAQVARLPVAMTNPVNAGNSGAASLAEEKVDGFPD